MSNRTLIEINHDRMHNIERCQRQFLDALIAYCNSATDANAEKLEDFGFKVFGMRHHSEGLKIEYGKHRTIIKGTER